MEQFLNGLLWIAPITGVTINTVITAPQFKVLMYIVIACSFLLSFAIIRKNDIPAWMTIKKALITTFFVSGMVWAIYAEVIWGAWLKHDIQLFSGLDTEHKLLALDRGLYDISRIATNEIHDNYQLFSSDDYIRLRLEYFLLPLRKRSYGNNIIVIADKDAQYDSTTRTFTSGSTRVDQVVPIVIFAKNAYILRKQRP